MNCELCQNNLESYLDGTLPGDIRDQVEVHLKTCKDCSRIYYEAKLLKRVMDEEKNLEGNPFLATRIMAGIDNEQVRLQPQPLYRRLVTPFIIGVSIVFAIGIGIMQGSIYNVTEPELPVELVYLNDAALESVYALTNQ